MKNKLVLVLLFTVGIFAHAQTLILPVTGVQPEEARTIASFVAKTLADNPIDQSRNTSLVPEGGRPWGIGAGAVANMANVISQHKAKEAIGINVQPSGTGKLATIRRFDDKGKLARLIDVQYSDPFEFWIKLQQPDETFRRAEGGLVWVIYRQGVNRAEAEELMQLWFADLVSMGAQGLKAIDDQTAGFEAAAAAMEKEGANWQAIIDENIQYFKTAKILKDVRPRESGGSGIIYFAPFHKVETNVANWRAHGNFYLTSLWPITNKIPRTYPRDLPVILFDVSRQGNRTRIEAVKRFRDEKDAVSGSFITEYESAAQFIRNLRANSFGLVNTLYKDPLEFAFAGETYRSEWVSNPAALSGFKTGAAVPNTFIQVKRPPAAPGEVPGGGFYMSRNMITQQEFEAVMGSNPSRQKGANLPVHNVNLLEALEYCNRLSLRDGLMPAYDIFFWEGIKRDRIQKGIHYAGAVGDQRIIDYPGQTAKVITDRYANGYRLPTVAEWDFALTNGAVNPVVLIRNLTERKDIEDYGWFAANSNGRVQPVGQKKPINGFYDLIGNVMEFVFDGSDFETRGDKRDLFQSYIGASAYLRGGDYRTDYNMQRYVVIAVMPSATMREYTVITPNDLDGKKLPNVELTPGFRVVRPVLDYWAYRSREEKALAWSEPAALAPENPAQLKAEREAAAAKVLASLENNVRMEPAAKTEAIKAALQRHADRNTGPAAYRDTLPRTEQNGKTLVLYPELPVRRSGGIILYRTSEGGRENARLRQIDITDQTITFDLVPVGQFADNPQNILLLDMDTQQVYNPTGFRPLTFTGVTGSRFTLISLNIEPPYYIDEIYLGQRE